MLSQLPAEGSVSLFLAVLLGTVRLLAVFATLMLVAVFGVGVGTVLLMKCLGFFPRMTLARDRGKEKSGGSSGEEGGQFHAGAGCSGSTGDGKRYEEGTNRQAIQMKIEISTFLRDPLRDLPASAFRYF